MESDEWEIRSRAPVEQQDIDEIIEWLTTQPHLPQTIPGDLIKSFLHSNYLNIEKTKKTIETYYHMKTTSPEFFNNRDINSKALQQVWDVIDMCVLPQKSAMGYVVVFARLKDCDPNRFVLEDAIKLLFMVIDSVLISDPTPSGFIFLFDNEGFTIRHLLKVTASILRKYFTYLQEGMPIRMKEAHVTNVNFIVTHVMTLIKPFLNGSHEIILHSPGNTSDLFKAVPQEILPEEYGGTSPCLNDLKELSYNHIRQFTTWFEKDESLRIDESKRIKSSNYSGISGFFRRISFN